MNIGDIVCMELILFKNGVDHDSKSGRPCVYIGEKNDVMYFIPLQSVKNKSKGYYIKPDNYNKLKKTSILNLHTILEKRAQFFKVDGIVREEEMETIMKILVSYFKDARREQSSVVKSLAIEYLDRNKKDIKFVDKDIKKKQDKRK